MIRHIFISTFQEEISDEIQKKEIADMRAMKCEIPVIVDQKVGSSTGWAGPKNQIVMTVDLKNKEDFEVYMHHRYRYEYSVITGQKYLILPACI